MIKLKDILLEKEKPLSKKKSGNWWQRASKTVRSNYIKKHGGPPNK